ncbi:MAG: hypothetical protein EBE86_002760 [Hormoscilla sp. GUM202]|nr:hypothetical protein [Hormoscilla sp. GUM202]
MAVSPKIGKMHGPDRASVLAPVHGAIGARLPKLLQDYPGRFLNSSRRLKNSVMASLSS